MARAIYLLLCTCTVCTPFENHVSWELFTKAWSNSSQVVGDFKTECWLRSLCRLWISV